MHDRTTKERMAADNRSQEINLMLARRFGEGPGGDAPEGPGKNLRSFLLGVAVTLAFAFLAGAAVAVFYAGSQNIDLQNAARITNSTSPSDNGDGATKSYVDALNTSWYYNYTQCVGTAGCTATAVCPSGIIVEGWAKRGAVGCGGLIQEIYDQVCLGQTFCSYVDVNSCAIGTPVEVWIYCGQ